VIPKKPPKTKVCRICKTSYTPRSSLQVVCSPPCAIAHAEKARQKREKCEQKAVRKVDREKKQKLKTRSDWIKEAQIACNKYIRLRDEHLPCISCGRFHNGQYHAGHFRTTRAAPQLRFEEDNIHKQCSACNNYLSGNLILYRINIIKKLGLAKVEWLESNNSAAHWSIEDIIEIKRHYTQKTKELLKQRELLTNP
jgi:hypothetical protein